MINLNNKLPQMRNLKASEIAADMRLGWNLGNTLDSYSNYRLFAFYSDGTDYVWNQSPMVSFSYTEDGKALSATLAWNMNSIKSTDASKPRAIGFEIINITNNNIVDSPIQAEVMKAEIKYADKVYSFNEFIGKQALTFRQNGVAPYLTSKFNSVFTSSGQLKQGTFTVTVKLTSESWTVKPERYETLWGNPVTTKALIDKLKEQGFQAVRIPVTWFTNMDAGGNVYDSWLGRVEEVVNYVLANGMYCIINVHHDTGTESVLGSGWLDADISDQKTVNRFTNLWKQIAIRFRDYSDYLLFEGFNEIIAKRSDGSYAWETPNSTMLNAVNELNQLFVNTVRASGGNNASRFLVVNPYMASTLQNIIDAFILPTDTIADHLIVEVHDYEPAAFSFNSSSVTWTAGRNTWGTQTDMDKIDAIFNRLEKRFTSKGIPVIIGEFGSSNKNNTADRINHAKYFVSAAHKKNIICFWWDNGGNFSGDYKGMGLINRTTLEWVYPDIVKALISSAAAIMTEISTLPVTAITQQAYTGSAITPVITIKDGDQVLILNTDYSVAYTNNILPGKANVTITGLGKYIGTTGAAFIIVPKKVTITRLSGISVGTALVQWDTSVGASGYQVFYNTSLSGAYKLALTTTTPSCIINNLTSGRINYVKVRAFVTVDGKSYFGEYSAAKSIAIK